MFKACGAGYSPLSPDIGDRLNAATGAAGRLLPIMVILGSKIPTAVAGPLCQLVDGLPRGNWRLGRSVLPPYALECRWNGLRRGGTAVPETFAGDCLRLWRVGTRAEYDACCSGGDGCPELGGAGGFLRTAPTALPRLSLAARLFHWNADAVPLYRRKAATKGRRLLVPLLTHLPPRNHSVSLRVKRLP
jgi:hypothetical protein